MALHFEMLGCMYVCVTESVFACSSVHACVYMCGCMVMYLVCILQNCVNARALHIESSFEHTLNSRMKTLLHLHLTAAALRLSVRITSDQLNFWCLDIFLLGHCIT